MADIFNHIYTHNTWGNSQTGKPYSGGGSDLHNTQIYRDFISNVVKSDPSIKKVLDLGCGDFRVGSNINWQQVEKVYAWDISEVVIKSNVETYKSNPLFEFSTIQEEYPLVDMVLIRQVLQHLSFQDIENIITKVFKTKARYIYITDDQPHLYTYTNVDKATAPSIRNSGLYLETYPFNLQVQTVLEYKSQCGNSNFRTVRITPYDIPIHKGINLSFDEQCARGKPKKYIEETLTILDKRLKGKSGLIVEVGTARSLLTHDLDQLNPVCCNDGHSTYLWARTKHQVYTVDIDSQAIQNVKAKLPNVNAYCQDGIAFLRDFEQLNASKIDLLFLDAWDVVEGCPYAEKSLESYLVVKDKLHAKSLILIDDTDVGQAGKGKLLIPELLRDGYQILRRGRQTLLSKVVEEIDVVIPYVGKDSLTIQQCLNSLVTYLPEVDQIYIICPEKLVNSITTNHKINYITDESFNFQPIDDYLCKEALPRHNWYLQQLLKLHILNKYPQIKDNLLIIDSDVILLKPMTFIMGEKLIKFNIGLESQHYPYFHHLDKLLKIKPIYKFSAISHMMLFNRSMINEFLNEIKVQHPEDEAWQTILKLVYPHEYPGAGFSEYESIFNYVCQKYPTSYMITNTMWKNEVLANLTSYYVDGDVDLIPNSVYMYIACHNYE